MKESNHLNTYLFNGKSENHYKMGILPAFLLRCLYHTEYEHLEFIKYIEETKEALSLELCNTYKGIDFSLYLENLRFL